MFKRLNLSSKVVAAALSGITVTGLTGVALAFGLRLNLVLAGAIVTMCAAVAGYLKSAS